MDNWIIIKAFSLILCFSTITYLIIISLKKQQKENFLIKIIAQKKIDQKISASIIEVDEEKILIVANSSYISLTKIKKNKS